MPHSSCLRSVKHASRQRGPRSAIRVQPRRRCPSPSRRLHAPPAGCKLVPDSPVAAARSLSWRCDCDCGCHHSDSCWHRLSTALSAIVPTSLPALNDPHLYMHYTHTHILQAQLQTLLPEQALFAESEVVYSGASAIERPFAVCLSQESAGLGRHYKLIISCR